MYSLDQLISMLGQRTENAANENKRLKEENAALRRKCAELTNALSSKTEQFSAFQSDREKVEKGILQALERLDFVENTIHTNSAEKTANSIQEENAVQSMTQTVSEEVTKSSFDTASPVEEKHAQKENRDIIPQNTPKTENIPPAEKYADSDENGIHSSQFPLF